MPASVFWSLTRSWGAYARHRSLSRCWGPVPTPMPRRPGARGLPDWIGSHTRAFAFFGGVPNAIVCDNLKSGVTKPLWFDPTVNRTFEDMAAHYDTAVLPTRVRKPRDKAKVEVAVQVVERWILARLRNRQFFSLAALNATIAALLRELNDRPMRQIGKSRRELFDALERPALKALPPAPYQYAEWKRAKVHPDYHVEVDRNFYSVPHQLIGRKVEVRLTLKTVEIFHDHRRVASHIRRSQRNWPYHRRRAYAQGPSALRQYHAQELGPPCR